MTEIIKRKWKNGKLISETKREVDWKPNAADLDCETVACACGNSFEMPFDALFGLPDMHCGQCGEQGRFKVQEQTP